MTARTAWPVESREACAGFRNRTASELLDELLSGCQRLGVIADQWLISGFLPADLPAVDRTIAGLYCVMVALRAGGIQ